MSITQVNITIKADGENFLTRKLSLDIEEKNKIFELFFEDFQFYHLFNAFQERKCFRREIKERENEKRIKEQADQLVNHMANLPTTQKIRHVFKHVALPLMKRCCKQRKKEEPHYGK